MTFDGDLFVVGSQLINGAQFAQNGITATVIPLRDQSGVDNPNGFVFADAAPAAPLATGNALRFNNASILVYVDQLGFRPGRVEFEFVDKGGRENIAVQSSNIIVGEIANTPSPIDGISVAISAGHFVMRPSPGKFVVGGQELWIDNICAYRDEK